MFGAVIGGLNLRQMTLHSSEMLHHTKIAHTPAIQFATQRMLELFLLVVLTWSLVVYGSHINDLVKTDSPTYSQLIKACGFSIPENLLHFSLIGHTIHELGQIIECGSKRYFEDR